MKFRFSILIAIVIVSAHVQALTISEIMSNPVGDDSGREWVEVYNETSSSVDLSSLTMSIKGGSAVSVIPLQGGTSLQPGGYAIISSIVSSASPVSKFLDPGTGYPDYTGILMRSASSISLVNTGSTSLDIRLGGNIVDSISYTPAGEGKTLSRIQGSFIIGTPTPGAVNEPAPISTQQSQSNDTQPSVSQQAPPSPDIVLYLPSSRLVVAGAETDFSVYGMTRAGQSISDMTATWAFGDGGQAIGTTTVYAYAYPGKYMARVEAGNNSVRGIGTTEVMVVTPEVHIASHGTGKYGAYVDIENPNDYDLDLSQWKLHINYQTYAFPKHTTLPRHTVTRISGRAMGFDKTEFASGTAIRITFPNLEEVTKYSISENKSREVGNTATSTRTYTLGSTLARQVKVNTQVILPKESGTTTQTTSQIKTTRDTRLVSWVRSLFGMR